MAVDEGTANKLADLMAKRFIQRRDVKARQFNNGYVPVHEKWTRQDLVNHIQGKNSWGHYLLDKDNNTKLFAFDIDLEQTGWYPEGWNTEEDPLQWVNTPFNPREAWQDRAHPSRAWLKYQMRMVSGKLAKFIYTELNLPTAVAYSGHKGIHVYGFIGSTPAGEAREAAEIVLGATKEWQVSRGKNFYKHVNQSPLDGYPNFSLELFPKQDSLEGKDLGNLMRLPLGRNLRSKDPAFFVDVNAPMAVFQPLDPITALEVGNPWSM